jgi:hypothetical protein
MVIKKKESIKTKNIMNKTTMIRYLNSLKKLEGNKKEYRSKSKLSMYLNDVLIGLILSDGHLERSRDRGLELAFLVPRSLDPSIFTYKCSTSYDKLWG